MSKTPEHVASLAIVIFEAAAAALRERGETAHAFLVSHSASEFTSSLEINREDGNWQRNLVASIDPSGQNWTIDMRITDDEQRTVARIGEVEVATEELGKLPWPWLVPVSPAFVRNCLRPRQWPLSPEDSRCFPPEIITF